MENALMPGPNCIGDYALGDDSKSCYGISYDASHFVRIRAISTFKLIDYIDADRLL